MENSSGQKRNSTVTDEIKKWSQWAVGIVVGAALLGMLTAILVPTLFRYFGNYHAVAFRDVQADGREAIKILASESSATCEGAQTPLWTISLQTEVDKIQPPLSFKVEYSAQGNLAFKSVKNKNPEAAVTGDVQIINKSQNGNIKGSFSLTTQSGKTDKGKFNAKWCGAWPSVKKQ